MAANEKVTFLKNNSFYLSSKFRTSILVPYFNKIKIIYLFKLFLTCMAYENPMRKNKL